MVPPKKPECPRSSNKEAPRSDFYFLGCAQCSVARTFSDCYIYWGWNIETDLFNFRNFPGFRRNDCYNTVKTKTVYLSSFDGSVVSVTST